jgi:hypothetical protein
MRVVVKKPLCVASSLQLGHTRLHTITHTHAFPPALPLELCTGFEKERATADNTSAGQMLASAGQILTTVGLYTIAKRWPLSANAHTCTVTFEHDPHPHTHSLPSVVEVACVRD